MSLQRRRGIPMTVYPSIIKTDLRGNKRWEPDFDNPIEVKGAFIPERGSRAEVPGQQQIDVGTIIIPADFAEVNVFSRVEFRGRQWDIVTPPQYHHGTRRVRHWSAEVRRRSGT